MQFISLTIDVYLLSLQAVISEKDRSRNETLIVYHKNVHKNKSISSCKKKLHFMIFFLIEARQLVSDALANDVSYVLSVPVPTAVCCSLDESPTGIS